MCNKETGMVYYATSYQDGYSINQRTDVKKGYLYLQISGMKPNALEDSLQVLNHSSNIRYDDGSSYHAFRDVKLEEVELLLNNCKFVTPWSKNEYFSILNEGDCFNPIGDFIGLSSQTIQNRKIVQMPKEVQEIMGFHYDKRI